MRRMWAAGVVVLLPWSALGQTPDEAALAATRRGLIDQADEAREAGDHPRSLSLAEQAGRLGMSPSLRRFVAEELRAIGRLAEAFGTAERCVTEASRDVGSPTHTEHMAACQTLADDLRPRLAHVVVRAQGEPPPGFEARVSGALLPAAALGVPYAVDPGGVDIDAQAPGFQGVHRHLEFAPGATLEVLMALSRDRPRGVSRRLNLAPLAVAGAGALSLGLSGVFFALRQGALESSEALCVAQGCPEAARPAYDRAGTYNTLTNVALGVGFAALAGAAVWFALAPTRASQRATAWRVEPHGLGITLRF